MVQKPHVPPVVKQATSTTVWRRNALMSVALLLACVLAVKIFLGQRTGAAQMKVLENQSAGLGFVGQAPTAQGMGMDMSGSLGGGSSMMSGAGPRQELEARVAPLVNRLRGAKDDDQKKAIQGELSGILEGYFDQDLKRRLAKTTSIEARVQRLRDQCEQRKQAKEEILQLQMKVLEYQAAGLGFFGQAAADQGMGMDMGMEGAMGGGRGGMMEYGGDYGGEMGYGAGSSTMSGAGPRRELEARVAPLVNRLRDAEGDDEKKAVQRDLSGILEDYFDQDLKRRLAKLTSVEARVQRLRDQCEQRKQAKEEILQLQMKVLEYQAAGLAFFGQAAADQGTGMDMGGSMDGGYGTMPGAR